MAELHDAVLYSEIGVGREGKGRESFIIPGKERGGGFVMLDHSSG